MNFYMDSPERFDDVPDDMNLYCRFFRMKFFLFQDLFSEV